jgi:hypothetical protein
MPFVKGQPRPANAGRRKGTPNRKKADLEAMCEAAGVEPFEVLLGLCKSRDEGIRLGAAKEASKYLYYQKRIQEISGPNQGPIEVESSAVEELLSDFKAILHTKTSERKG